MSVDEKRLDSANFELIDAEKEFLKNICKTVNDIDSNDKKDEAFWRDFLFLAYTGLWEDVKHGMDL